MSKRGGLGRNLSVLLSQKEMKQETPQKESELLKLPIKQLQPGKYQPRGEFDDASLHELAESIRKQGLLQPIVVRQLENQQYEIIAGERRWRACQILAMTEVPVTLKQVDDETAMAMALVENLQREDLNAMDQARAMQRLTIEFGLTHQQVADLVSKSRTAVSNFLRLMNLAADVKVLLENGDLDMGHARALLMLTAEQQSEVAKIIVSKNLSVRETEALVQRVASGKPISVEKQIRQDIAHSCKNHVDTLAMRLQTQIKIKQGKNGKGTVVIHYNNETNLEKMMEFLIKN